jgi:hypothetical protein
VLTASALAFSAGAAWSQSAPAPKAPPSRTTTVGGISVNVVPTPKITFRQSWDFVQEFVSTPNPERDQMARWFEPVCVQAFGLPEAQRQVIEGRIEEVARQIGLKAPRAGCRPNVEIVFTDKPQAFMDGVYEQHRMLLGYYSFRDGKRLKMVSRPIQAWYLSGTRALYSGFRNIDIQDACELGYCWGMRWTGPSGRIGPSTRSEFVNILVVADKHALEGKDAGLLADYLLMITLAQPKRPDECRSLPSVLDVLLSPQACPHDVPDGLSPADAAYLTALYKADLEQKKNFQWGDISGRMSNILVKANFAEK